MPLYDVQCLECKKEFEAFSLIEERTRIKCKCGGSCKILITNFKSEHWFKPHWNPNFRSDKPVYVRSLNHYKQLCKKHGVTSRAIGDVRNCYDGKRHGYDTEQP
jgi:putative FmdB family regulatory protein